jgi:mannose-6-phosphate isomerase-like protein (cupin superfamily)
MMTQKQNIAAIAATLPRPFIHAVVGQVDDYCVYLSRFRGLYKFHSHNRDEMYLVLKGEIDIDYDDGRRVKLRPQESLVVKAGEIHRSGAEHESLVLMFKACDLFAE